MIARPQTEGQGSSAAAWKRESALDQRGEGKLSCPKISDLLHHQKFCCWRHLESWLIQMCWGGGGTFGEPPLLSALASPSPAAGLLESRPEVKAEGRAPPAAFQPLIPRAPGRVGWHGLRDTLLPRFPPIPGQQKAPSR